MGAGEGRSDVERVQREAMGTVLSGGRVVYSGRGRIHLSMDRWGAGLREVVEMGLRPTSATFQRARQREKKLEFENTIKDGRIRGVPTRSGTIRKDPGRGRRWETFGRLEESEDG